MKLSQTSSRMIAKYLKQAHGIVIEDALEFWGYSPEEVVEWVKDNHNVKVSVKEILKAGRVG